MKLTHAPLMACALIALAAAGAARGQYSAPPTRAPAALSQSQETAELAEAARLSREVVQLYSAGKYAEALPPAERAVALREKALGPDHQQVADALANLAATLAALKQTERARQAYERAVVVFEARLGPDADKTINTRESLGWLHYWKRDFGKAETTFKSALTGREKALVVESPRLLGTLAGLAAVYLATGEAGKREATYSRLLDLLDKFDGKPPDVVGKVLESYLCTGASHRNAGEEQAAVYKRIMGRGRKPKESDSIQGGVLNGRAISKPAPPYPITALQSRVQGTVVVRITVDETGRVVSAEPLCGPSLLQDAAVSAAKNARFTPTLLSGQPVKVTGTITYNFNLQ